MPSNYGALRASCLQYLDLHTSQRGRTGREEELRTCPLFSLAVKELVDRETVLPQANSESDMIVLDSGSDNSSASTGQETSAASTEDTRAENTSVRDTIVIDDSRGDTSAEDASHRRVMPILPQFGLLGCTAGPAENQGIPLQEPVMFNVGAPNSFFICGSQGSGKSYTLSCILENCLLADSKIGRLQHPLAGVVFHYDVDAANSVAEIAHLCSRGIPVQVLVSKSNLHNMRSAYTNLPGAKECLTVKPLVIPSRDFSVDRIHKLMAFSERGTYVPLYMEVLQRILREMATENQGEPFDYVKFRSRILNENLTRDQMTHLNMRFGILESFMAVPSRLDRKVTTTPKPMFNLRPGTLTIVDLSDSFVDSATACVLFDVCLSMIKEKRPACGLVLALDEAHKFMDASSAAENFTNRLLTTIREQRHNATRVIIATQEPTISDRLLDLCSVSIVHRFTSPSWFASIREHLGAASRLVKSDAAQGDLFEQIVDLQVGESLVFAPSAFVGTLKSMPQKLGRQIMKMKTRLRLGEDGGKSVLAI